MWNFQGIVFIWTQAYSEIFKSALVYLETQLGAYALFKFRPSFEPRFRMFIINGYDRKSKRL